MSMTFSRLENFVLWLNQIDYLILRKRNFLLPSTFYIFLFSLYPRVSGNGLWSCLLCVYLCWFLKSEHPLHFPSVLHIFLFDLIYWWIFALCFLLYLSSHWHHFFLFCKYLFTWWIFTFDSPLSAEPTFLYNPRPPVQGGHLLLWSGPSHINN